MAFLELLQDEGVTHVFGNPGTTELALMEAMPEASGLNYVLGLQEAVVVAMADGFARASGRLTACNLHCTPGLGHAMGALYNAKFSGSPIIVTAGQYEIGYGLLEPMLYEPLVPIAQPLVKWAYEIQRVEDLPRVVRRAAKVALTPPCGPVFLSLPGSILDDDWEFQLGQRTRVVAHGLPPSTVQQELIDAFIRSDRPLIIAGRELAEQDAMAEAAALSELLGAPVFHEPVPYNGRFPSRHPAFMGDLTRNQTKVRQTLAQHDLLIVLGADMLRMSAFSTADPFPSGLKVVHISERDWELGKNYPTDLAVRAGVGETLRAILPRLRESQSIDQAKAAAARLRSLTGSNWSANRERLLSERPVPTQGQMIDALLLVKTIAEHLPRESIIVEEAPTTAPTLASVVPVEHGRNYLGLASGGLGFGMGGAVGASLARPGIPVVAVIGDGSAMYAIQALWTAAHLKLPVKFLIVNNRSYRIIKERMVAMRNSDQFLGMDLVDPTLDFVALAKGMGVDAARVVEMGDLGGALASAMRSTGPFLLDIVVDGGTQRVTPRTG
jgi:benzoylformate decarboxylase